MSATSDPSETRRCHAIVEECEDCQWRGGNYPGQPCVKCGGDVIERPCKNFAIRGGAVCRHHGASPKVKRAGRRRLAIARADAQLSDIEYEPVTNPLADLADLAGQEKAVVAWAQARVEALANEITYRDADDVEQLSVAVAVMERARERAARRLESLTKFGLEERRVAIEAAKVELVRDALLQALKDAGIDNASPVIEAFAIRVAELEKQRELTPADKGK